MNGFVSWTLYHGILGPPFAAIIGFLSSLNWAGLDWTGLGWTGLDWTGMTAMSCSIGTLGAGRKFTPVTPSLAYTLPPQHRRRRKQTATWQASKKLLYTRWPRSTSAC